jgi:hypothetical protein
MSETTAPPRRSRRTSQELTEEKLRNLVTKERPYKVSDGNSLYVLVAPTGLRSWRWRYYIRGREKMLLLGSYPQLGLEQARTARDQAREKVLAGIDPADEKREAKLALLIAQVIFRSRRPRMASEVGYGSAQEVRRGCHEPA